MRNNEKMELWLFTQNFPFGHGEAFLENELPVLAQGFHRVRLFPLHVGGLMRPVPAHVEVSQAFGPVLVNRSISPLRLLLRYRTALKLWRTGRKAAPSAAIFRKHRREFLSQLRQALERERVLHKRFAREYDPRTVRLYAYWTTDWATVLGIWRRRNKKMHFVSRMHGFDMFAQRAVDGWPRFRNFQVKQVERIYVASQAGMDYLATQFPQYRNRFKLAYVATTNHGPGPWSPADVLRVVSCSNLVELKRVPLIAEALRHIHGRVQWTHFGEGPQREAVERVASTLPSHVQVHLMGSSPNSEVIAWYKANPVDVFVHASRTEGGAPVALQEAASFGIPLVAADAGGVAEVVTAESGVLLPNGLTAEMLGSTLDRFRNSAWYGHEARMRVRAFWASRFEAGKVYGALLDQLKAN